MTWTSLAPLLLKCERGRGLSSLGPPKKLRRAYAEPLCEGCQVVHGHGCFTALEFPDVRAVQPAGVSQLFLRQVSGQPQLVNNVAEADS